MLEIDGCCLGRRVGSRLTRGSSSCLQRKFERATSSSGGTASRREICCSLAALRLSCRPDRVRQDRTSNSPGRPQEDGGSKFVEMERGPQGCPRESPARFSSNKPEQNVACASVLQCDLSRQGVASRALSGVRRTGRSPVGKKQKVHRVVLFQIFLLDDVAQTRIQNGGSLGLFLS